MSKRFACVVIDFWCHMPPFMAIGTTLSCEAECCASSQCGYNDRSKCRGSYLGQLCVRGLLEEKKIKLKERRD